jgi:hypothetical protein
MKQGNRSRAGSQMAQATIAIGFLSGDIGVLHEHRASIYNISAPH